MGGICRSAIASRTGRCMSSRSKPSSCAPYFSRYLEAGSVVRLKQQLDAEGFRIPIRIDGAGRSTGGGLFSRGHIYKLLSNPIYVGRIAHKGQVHEGQHPPIVTPGPVGRGPAKPARSSRRCED